MKGLVPVFALGLFRPLLLPRTKVCNLISFGRCQKEEPWTVHLFLWICFYISEDAAKLSRLRRCGMSP